MEKSGRRDQRKSSFDKKTPLLKNKGSGFAFSENMNKGEMVLIKPRSIIKQSKFKMPTISVHSESPEDRMVSLKGCDLLPSSLFEEDNSKFLAVSKWKSEMLVVAEGNSPKSTRCSRKPTARKTTKSSRVAT